MPQTAEKGWTPPTTQAQNKYHYSSSSSTSSTGRTRCTGSTIAVLVRLLVRVIVYVLVEVPRKRQGSRSLSRSARGCQKPQEHTHTHTHMSEATSTRTSPHTILHFSHDRFSLGLPALRVSTKLTSSWHSGSTGTQGLDQLQLFAPDDAVGMKTLGSPCGAAWGSEPGERWPS